MNKKNLPLYLALAIPLAMILLLAGFIYLPGIGKSPKQNFLYMSGNNIYAYGQPQYMVSGGKLIYNPKPINAPINSPGIIPDDMQPHFYLYNVSKDSAVEITFQEAQNYKLDSSVTSADGYTVQRGSGGGDFIFGGGSSEYNSWFIKGNNRSKKLNLKLTSTPYYSDNFQFLGWVE